MGIQIKIHKSYRNVVVLVDSNLIGNTYEEGIKQIKINPNFFKGEEKSPEEIIKILKDMDREDATFNIVGENAIKIALESGIIKKEGIMTIDKIPIALGLM